MTAVIWANVLLAVPFLLAFIAVPLWMTFKRPQTPPGHSQARAYLRAKAALADAAPAAAGSAAMPHRAPADRIAVAA